MRQRPVKKDVLTLLVPSSKPAVSGRDAEPEFLKLRQLGECSQANA